jgi:hypothetical protein
MAKRGARGKPDRQLLEWAERNVWRDPPEPPPKKRRTRKAPEPEQNGHPAMFDLEQLGPIVSPGVVSLPPPLIESSWELAGWAEHFPR